VAKTENQNNIKHPSHNFLGSAVAPTPSIGVPPMESLIQDNQAKHKHLAQDCHAFVDSSVKLVLTGLTGFDWV
jgi:hypothetical protein